MVLTPALGSVHSASPQHTSPAHIWLLPPAHISLPCTAGPCLSRFQTQCGSLTARASPWPSAILIPSDFPVDCGGSWDCNPPFYAACILQRGGGGAPFPSPSPAQSELDAPFARAHLGRRGHGFQGEGLILVPNALEIGRSLLISSKLIS